MITLTVTYMTYLTFTDEGTALGKPRASPSIEILAV